MANLSKVNGTDSFKNMVEKVNDTIERVNGIGVSLSDLELDIKDFEQEVEDSTAETTAKEMNDYLAELYPAETAAATVEGEAAE